MQGFIYGNTFWPFHSFQINQGDNLHYFNEGVKLKMKSYVPHMFMSSVYIMVFEISNKFR